ncbi:Fructose-1,6-bisphosphatase, cytosolic [Glycine soja]
MRRDWRNSYAGETNAKGEEQKKLDVLSNELFVKALISSGRRCLLVSEEVEEAIFVPSSHRGKSNEAEVSLEDALQPGNQMLAAGYCMYGSSCTFVLSKGNGVKFILTHPNIKEVRLSQEKIHEGLPVFLGSYDDMEQMKELYAASKEDDY